MTEVLIHDVDREIVAGIGCERSVKWASTSSGSHSRHLVREIPSRLACSVSCGEEIDQHRQDRDRPRRKVPGSTRETLEPQVPRPDMERDARRHPISGRTMRYHVKRKRFGYRAHRAGRRDRVPAGKCSGRAFETLCVSRVSGDCLATGVIASHWRAFTRSIRQIILPRGAFLGRRSPLSRRAISSSRDAIGGCATAGNHWLSRWRSFTTVD